MKAMILAAGLGTTLKPWTDLHPKALALVNGKSLLEWNIEYLQQYGIKEVIVNVHHFAEQITAAIAEENGWGSEITISDETNEVLETGGGLKKAAWYFNDEKDFVLMNVDILTDMDLGAMIARHRAAAAIATLAVRERATSRYFLFNDKNELCGWRNVNTGAEKIVRESPPLYQKAFSGIHVIGNRLLSQLEREGKFSMVDVYLDIAKDNRIQAFDHSGSRFIDVGKPESVAQAEKMFS
jgi:N-acetyl-alpha-D-muramate 1-phosphate uridylyltransferase